MKSNVLVWFFMSIILHSIWWSPLPPPHKQKLLVEIAHQGLKFTSLKHTVAVMTTYMRANFSSDYSAEAICSRHYYYPTALRRVQITLKTSTNITWYLYSRGPVRQVSCH